jgi:hypothetical protein
MAGAMSAPGRPWIPAQIRWTPTGPLVDWCHLGDLRFTAPMFEQTIGTAMAHPFNLLFRQSTPLAAMLEPVAFELRPAGLIFHMSRCGSTLVSRMLATLPENVVLSEPDPLDQVLRVRSRALGVTDAQIVALLRGMTAALGRRRHAEECDLFIKLEGWHMLQFPLIRSAFPDVPWIFLYRDPLEVLASLERLRPRQMLPGGIDAGLLGLDPATASGLSDRVYGARVLERICTAALAHCADGGRLIAYRQLPGAVLDDVFGHFGLRCGAEARARMGEVARFHAKRPDVRYADDSEEKRRDADQETRALAARLAPLYAQLDTVRLAQPAVAEDRLYPGGVHVSSM